jgi:hypothetical protein
MGVQQIAPTQQRIASDIKTLHTICHAIQYQPTVAPDALAVPAACTSLVSFGQYDHRVSVFLEIGQSCADCMSGLLNKHNLDIGYATTP